MVTRNSCGGRDITGEGHLPPYAAYFLERFQSIGAGRRTSEKRKVLSNPIQASAIAWRIPLRAEIAVIISTWENGRSGRIRTCDPCVPNAVLYRAEPRSDKKAAYSVRFRALQEAGPKDFDPVKVDLKTQILPADAAGVAEAARRLAAGGLVAFPTETVYGLGADAAQAPAAARIYEAKGRPSFNPLIAHVADLAAARQIARFDAAALKIAEAFWPGPLTLVLPKAAQCPVAELATAGLDTVAIRVPAHPIAQALLRAFGGPVVAPSANISGRVSPTTAAHVASDLSGRIEMILDGGAVNVGVESTIVGCFEEPMLLRPGGLPREDIERLLGHPLRRLPADAVNDDDKPLAPGMLASHYAPRTPVRLNATAVGPDEALLAFGPAEVNGGDAAKAAMNLSAAGDLAEAAANLFGYLRALDARSARAIAVMPVPHHGLGEAINDRLRRAAIGR
jgi:L-threonylcarbamoyladenylate synthase